MIVVGATALSIAIAMAVHRFEERQAKARIDRRSDNVLSFLSEHLSPVSRSVAALQILFENSNNVSPAEFESAAESLFEENPEIGLFEWVPRVAAADRDRFIEETRRTVSKDFGIVDISPEGVRSPAPVRPVAWPITYIHPMAGNENVLGFDLVAGPTAATLRVARDTNRLTMAPPRPLRQNPGGGAALFFIQPVMGRNAQGAVSLLGFVQGISLASDALRPVLALAEENNLLIEITDITEGEAPPFLSTMEGRVSKRGETFATENVFSTLGRTLRVRIAPEDALLDSQSSSYSRSTLLAGLLATALLGLYLQSLLRRTATISNLVSRRTEELTESNRSLVREAEQRRHAEAAALSAQRSFKFLVDSVDGIVWQADTERDRIVFVNRRAEDILGYPSTEWLSTVNFWSKHLYSDDRDRAIKAFNEGVGRGGTFEHSYRMIAADGRVVWIHDHVRISHEQGQPRLAHVLSLDVTRQRASEELIERDAHFLANVDDALVVADLAGCVTFWNHGAEKTFGWTEDEVLGRPFKELFEPEIATAIERNFTAAMDGKPWTGEWTGRRKDGSHVTLDSRVNRYLDRDGNPAGIFTITRDITARKLQERESAALEVKLQHTQKLESLGVLAGGIAHDFNNLLTGILGHSSLLSMDLSAGHPMAASVAAIEQSALRAAALCQQMLAYAGRGKFLIEPVDIGELVRETSKMLETTIAKNAVLDCALQPETPAVRADATQLRQVVMNLVINAVESLGEKGGRVVVSTGTMHADRAMLDAALHGHDCAEGEYVFLQVQDDGCGIEPENLRKIFEPFFSTKFTGRGLGLAAVMGIVRGHNGALTVSSEPGKGTTFRILLSPSAEAAVRLTETEACAFPRQACTVLIIDDEAFVREAAATVLEKAGCTIASATSGPDGVARFGLEPDRFDVVLLDLTMPGMHGVEVLTKIRQIRPAQRVIVMSGFTADEAAHRFGDELPNAFLEKPFRAATLLAMVERFASPQDAG